MKKQIVAFISLTMLVATVRADVQPIEATNDDAWQLFQDVSTQADDIEQRVRAIADISCCCDVEIKQGDIPFTITAPGVYCLTDNVTVDENETGITIESARVVLDLKGHTIDGNVQSNTRGIFVDGNIIGTTTPANVVVKNGVIKRTKDNGVGMHILNAIGPVKLSNMKVTKGDSNGIIIDSSTGVLVEKCESSENEISGFLIQNSSQCVFRDCIARKNEVMGFSIVLSSECCFIGCKAFDNENGLMLVEGGSCFFHRCVAQGNSVLGFSTSSSNNNVFDECFAVSNGNDGFQNGNSNNNIFRRCLAGGNGDDGFQIVEGLHNQILNCSTVGNTARGINNGGAESQIFANAANNNGAGNYGGASGVSNINNDPDNETTYWTNVEP